VAERATAENSSGSSIVEQTIVAGAEGLRANQFIRSLFWRTNAKTVWRQRTTSTSRHSSQTMTTFCVFNVSGRSTYSSVHCRRQSVSCCSRSSVEQSSIARHCCPISPSSAVILNRISCHFVIPLLTFLSSGQSPRHDIILDTIIVITGRPTLHFYVTKCTVPAKGRI